MWCRSTRSVSTKFNQYIMDPLVELPIDKWPILREKMSLLWPLNVAGYYALQQNIEYPKVREAFKFKVYCPFGSMDNGFVSINVKKQPGPQDVILFSVTEDTSKLQQALLETKLVDWSQKVCIDLVSSLTLKCLNEIRTPLELRFYEVGLVKTYYLDRRTVPFQDLRCPSDTNLAPLEKEHIQQVDEAWPYRFPGSNNYFETLANNGLSFGLYSNKKLLAWVFLNEYNFICHLYCVEDHRRLGHGEYLLKFVVNDQLGRGNDLYGYTESGNDISGKLFAKLGFIVVDDGAYLFVQK